MIVLFTSLRMRPRVFLIQFDGFRWKGYAKNRRKPRVEKMANSMPIKCSVSETNSTYAGKQKIDEHKNALETKIAMFWMGLRDAVDCSKIEGKQRTHTQNYTLVYKEKWTWTYHARSIEICKTLYLDTYSTCFTWAHVNRIFCLPYVIWMFCYMNWTCRCWCWC